MNDGAAQTSKAVDVLKAAFDTPDVRVKELERGEGVICVAGIAP